MGDMPPHVAFPFALAAGMGVGAFFFGPDGMAGGGLIVFVGHWIAWEWADYRPTTPIIVVEFAQPPSAEALAAFAGRLPKSAPLRMWQQELHPQVCPLAEAFPPHSSSSGWSIDRSGHLYHEAADPRDVNSILRTRWRRNLDVTTLFAIVYGPRANNKSSRTKQHAHELHEALRRDPAVLRCWHGSDQMSSVSPAFTEAHAGEAVAAASSASPAT